MGEKILDKAEIGRERVEVVDSAVVVDKGMFVAGLGQTSLHQPPGRRNTKTRDGR